MYEIAHRGFSDLHKDNTMEAFHSAIEHNFDMIELDIQLTRDNQVIIYHDTFIGDKLIRNMNVDEVQALDNDIVTLKYFFSNIDLDKVCVYLDIKGSDFICIYLHQILKDIMNRNKILIGCFNLKLLERLYELDSTYNLGIITENVFPNEIINHYINRINLAFVSFHWTVLNHQAIRFLQMKGILVFTYTCKNQDIKSFIEEYNVDGIVTNYKF